MGEEQEHDFTYIHEEEQEMKEQGTQEASKRCCCCMEKHTLRSQEQKKALINRLRRIEGQVRGVQ